MTRHCRARGGGSTADLADDVKADHVTAWWDIVNWADVAERFATARTIHNITG